jgi:beta-lactamase regulating signal transducer with metallopeptidase domain
MIDLMLVSSSSHPFLLWFITVLTQVTILAALGLLTSHYASQQAVVRHSILTATLVFIVIAPLSTWLLQRAGIGFVVTSSRATHAAFKSSEFPPESRTPRDAVTPDALNLRLRTRTDANDLHENPPQVASMETNTNEGSQPIPLMSDSAGELRTYTRQTLPLADLERSHTPSSTLLLLGKCALSMFAVLWLIGSALMCLRSFVGWFRLKLLIHRSQELDDGEVKTAYLIACCNTACDPRAVRIVTNSAISTPMVAGILQPTILLPKALGSSLSDQQLLDVFIHELAHIVRRDQIVLALQQLARIFFWAHPLVEHVCKGVARTSEEVCDNYVLTQSATTAYSRTLLRVAELTTMQPVPLGTMGVVGGGWSLAERIAGLLDNRRDRITKLNRQSQLAVAIMAVCWSAVLLLTLGNTNKNASAESPIAQDPLQVGETQVHFRGAGDQLEFRLSGNLTSVDGTQLNNPRVTVREQGSTTDFSATVVGDRFEVWLPASSFKWLTLTLTATSDDGQRGGRIVGSSQLRTAIKDGVDLELRRASRSIQFFVTHQAQPAPYAHLKVRSTGYPSETTVQCNAEGEAAIALSPGDRLVALTAWTDSGLFGGYQFHQGPSRDPNGLEHRVELTECEQRVIQVTDSEGSPVPGVRLKLQVATPPPHFNYFGNPSDGEVVTDRTGTAHYRWFPKMEGVHHYAELAGDSQWLLRAQHNTEKEVRVEVKRPAERTRVEGYVSRGGQDVAGVVVQAGSFQGESEGQVDVRYAMTDAAGKFSFDALPNSTYALQLMDDQWVAEPSVFLPVHSESGERFTPYLMAIEGHPVTIQLTSGPERAPIAGQSVSLRSSFSYSWNENGEQQHGEAARDVFVTTNESGLATARVPLGSLRAWVYTPTWRSESEIVVAAGKNNRIELHRSQSESIEVKGRVVMPLFTQIDLETITVSVQSLDGETADEFTPDVDASGQFQFSTKSTAVGCFVYSGDGELAGSTLVGDLEQPFDLELFPSAYLAGQLLDVGGQPVTNHPVYAEPRIRNTARSTSTIGFSTSTQGRVVKAISDANGNYRVGPLPRRTEINLWCDPLESTKSTERENLGQYYLDLDEQRPPQVHRLGPNLSVKSKLQPAEQLAVLLRDAKLGGYHAMVILTDYSDDKCAKWVQRQLLDYNTNLQVSNYMQWRIHTGDSTSGLEKEYAIVQQWPLPTAGSVAAIALDSEGRELGRSIFDVSTGDAKGNAAVFVEAHLPTVVDAQQEWDEAFALAAKTNRRVWVRICQRYCSPCHLLNRWIDDHRDLLEKEFVLLKIDDLRNRNGAELANEITAGKPYGVPYFAFYSKDQEMLMNSIGPTGNIGFMSGFESKRHFRAMLEQGVRNLTRDAVEQLVNSLND